MDDAGDLLIVALRRHASRLIRLYRARRSLRINHILRYECREYGSRTSAMMVKKFEQILEKNF